jgi:hypothetical protein
MPLDGCRSRQRCPPTSTRARDDGPSGVQNIENTCSGEPCNDTPRPASPVKVGSRCPDSTPCPGPRTPNVEKRHMGPAACPFGLTEHLAWRQTPWGHVPPAGRRERPAQIGYPRRKRQKDDRLGPPRLSSAPPSHPACHCLPTRLSLQGLVSRTAKIQLQEVGGPKPCVLGRGHRPTCVVALPWRPSLLLLLFDLVRRAWLNTEQPARVCLSSSPPLDRSINSTTAHALLFSPEHATASDGISHRQDASAPVRLPLCHRHHLRRA